MTEEIEPQTNYTVKKFYTDKEYNELKQENAELKNKINKLGKKHEDYCNTMYWQMKEQIDKYCSALEEIREIATNYFEECGVPDDYFKRNNYSWKQHQIKAFTCKLQQIIDIVNEVLGNEI